MRKRFKKSNFIIRFLGHEATAEEVTHSHAYSKVARQDGPSLKPRRKDPDKQHIAGYRDSMVGSSAQYHDNTPLRPKDSEPKADASNDDTVVGNRPKSKTAAPSDADQRHRFTEPPKRGFDRFG